jgi:tol-pal system protein YbgF
MKLRILMLLGLCFAAPAQAGLFSDEDARKLSQDNQKEIQQLEARILKLEETNDRQTRSMLDLQSQIETLNSELRKLRGHNEELAHSVGDAEKRSKDFYVDLDTRLRHFESAEESAKDEVVPASGISPAAAVPTDSSALAIEDRAFESAYDLFKNGRHANAVKAFHEFLKKYPESAHVPNALYWLGSAKFALKDYKGALGFYQNLLKTSPTTPKAAEAMFNIAECQKELKQKAAAKKTLKQLIAQYPTSEAAGKAKKQLTSSK